jgi:hypothetical protein
MIRDLRDPLYLGTVLLGLPKLRRKLSRRYDEHPIVMVSIPDWKGDGFMSSNPANHHSGVKQGESYD